MSPRRTYALLAGFAVGMPMLLAGMRPALADPALAAPPVQLGAPALAEEETVVVKKWYGAPMLTVDVFAFGALAGAFLVEREHGDLATWLAVAGIGGYLVGGPAFHFFEQRFGMTLASLGMRLGAPFAGMFPGALIAVLVAKAYGHESDGGGAFITGMALGFFGGMVVAAAIDDFVIARKPVTAARTSVAILPVYQPTTHQTGLMLRATW